MKTIKKKYEETQSELRSTSVIIVEMELMITNMRRRISEIEDTRQNSNQEVRTEETIRRRNKRYVPTDGRGEYKNLSSYDEGFSDLSGCM